MSKSSDPTSVGSARRLARDLLLVLARERPRHMAFARKRMGNVGDAEDVIQLALLRAASHIDEVREGDRLNAWFWRILRNTIHDECQRILREQEVLQHLVTQETEPTQHHMATCACSLGVLAQLKPEYREILQRVDIDQEPLHQVAMALGIAPNNAAVRIYRARRAMRQALFDCCGCESSRACHSCGCEEKPLLS